MCGIGHDGHRIGEPSTDELKYHESEADESHEVELSKHLLRLVQFLVELWITPHNIHVLLNSDAGRTILGRRADTLLRKDPLPQITLTVSVLFIVVMVVMSMVVVPMIMVVAMTMAMIMAVMDKRGIFNLVRVLAILGHWLNYILHLGLLHQES